MPQRRLHGFPQANLPLILLTLDLFKPSSSTIQYFLEKQSPSPRERRRVQETETQGGGQPPPPVAKTGRICGGIFECCTPTYRTKDTRCPVRRRELRF
ncbi:hypothetical protein HanIR_Chr14g0690641 [Helianthus annuus]|nr:hypothetical protein HanIR_Chr14g0690641 [Helianthus annuus]